MSLHACRTSVLHETYVEVGQGDEAGSFLVCRWGCLASPPPPPPPPRTTSPPSVASGEGAGLQEEGGSLGEMMRCLVLLQR